MQYAHTIVTRNTKTSTVTYKIYTTYLMNIKTVACFGALRCVCVCVHNIRHAVHNTRKPH